MSLPIFEKIWQLSLNNFYESTNATRDMMLGIKNELIGFADNPWEVMYSCNSVTAGTAGDGIDRWATSSNIVSSGGAHSWMVLRQPALLSNFQILIDMNGSSMYNGDVIVSPNAGFTGGTTTARPTATDQVEVTPTPSWFSALTSTNCRVHVMMSTDGQCTRIFACSSGLIGGFWMFDKLKNPRPEITYPFIATVYGTDDIVTSASSYTKLNMNGGLTMAANGISVNADSFLTCEGLGSNPYGNFLLDPDDLDGSLPLLPMAAACKSLGARGRYGAIYDLWFGSAVTQNGDSYDETGNRAMSTMRDLIVPSNGLMLAVV
jgi:hypothetical protein